MPATMPTHTAYAVPTGCPRIAIPSRTRLAAIAAIVLVFAVLLITVFSIANDPWQLVLDLSLVVLALGHRERTAATNSAASVPGVSESSSLMITIVATGGSGLAVVNENARSDPIESGGSVVSVSEI